jgi:hypothetical protein
MIALLCWLTLAQEPTLDAVVARMQNWLLTFQTQLSGIVAEEAYVQDARILGRTATTTAVPLMGHRELKSDLLMVKPQGTDAWVQFRDVFEVDGKLVHNRSERLMDLFVTPTGGTRSQAERIMNESARYNIGAIERNINLPVFALAFLLPGNAQRFRFKLSTKMRPALMRDHLPAGAAVVEFQEFETPTLIKTSNDRDMPASGRYWVDRETGRILLSEMIASDGTLIATIDVLYGAGLGGLQMPVEMREQYEHRIRGTRIDGSASYGHFRQFQVNVDEQLAPIKK